MKTPTRPLHRRAALLVLGAALFSLAPFAAIAADDASAPQPLADQAAPLPLQATFHKTKSGENAGLFTLRLKNTSADTITATASIIVSVPVHNNPKVREEPAHAIKPGKSWSIRKLAAGDKVTVKADGFAPLELTVQ
jgi:hypothetical protein